MIVRWPVPEVGFHWTGRPVIYRIVHFERRPHQMFFVKKKKIFEIIISSASSIKLTNLLKYFSLFQASTTNNEWEKIQNITARQCHSVKVILDNTGALFVFTIIQITLDIYFLNLIIENITDWNINQYNINIVLYHCVKVQLLKRQIK